MSLSVCECLYFKQPSGEEIASVQSSHALPEWH